MSLRDPRLCIPYKIFKLRRNQNFHPTAARSQISNDKRHRYIYHVYLFFFFDLDKKKRKEVARSEDLGNGAKATGCRALLDPGYKGSGHPVLLLD